MKIAIGPIDIAGIAGSLAQGLRECGHEVTVALNEPHRFQYDEPASDRLIRVMQKTQRNWAARRSTRFHWLPAAVAARSMSWLVLLILTCTHDTFVYLFARTFTNTKAELRLLRLFRRNVVFIYCGSDLRPSFMDGPTLYALEDDAEPTARLAQTVRNQRQLIAYQESKATLCVAYPSCGHFLTKQFVNLAALGLPSRVRPDAELSRQHRINPSSGVRALHAPSDERVKGTSAVTAAVSALRAQGVPLELTVISGQSHERVVAELARCDFVIDQVYSDLALATLGVEAAHLGKPTIVAGYFADRIHVFLPSGALPPSLYVMPSGLADAVKTLATDNAVRRNLGTAAKDFVEANWSPRIIASQLVALLDGRGDPSLWCDPYSLDYFLGCGIPRDELLVRIRALVDGYGVEALMLHDKPLVLAPLLAMLER